MHEQMMKRMETIAKRSAAQKNVPKETTIVVEEESESHFSRRLTMMEKKK